MERKNQNLTAMQGHNTNKNQRANQSQEKPGKEKKEYVEKSQAEQSKITWNPHKQRGIRSGKEKAVPRIETKGKIKQHWKKTQCIAMQKEQETKAETTEKQHGKQTEETNINPCSSSSLCSNMKMQKNTRSWQSTDDHRVCRRPKSWHPCPGGGKGSYWACCCLHHTCTFRVASPEGVCGCQSEQNTSLEEGKALAVMPRRREG